MNKKKYVNLGVMKVAKKKDPSDENEAKRFFIQLQQQKSKDGKPYGDQIFPITLANGMVLKDGDILSMFAKKPKFQKSVEAGTMDQDKADFLSSFMLFDICASEDAGESDGNGSGGVDF